MSDDFWSGKRVLVTGHTGFKGSWLSLWLQAAGAEVVGYALPPPTAPNLFELANVEHGMESHFGDIRDRDGLHSVVSKARPQVVFHLAAQALVLESYENPLDTIDTNVMGTSNILNAARSLSDLRSLVVVTSDKCYENKEWHWGYREAEAMGGSDPYSMSKGCAELVTASFRQSFFSAKQSPGVATARAGNVIGGGDFARNRLLTDIMAAIRNGQPVKIRNPNSIRPWQHVLEPLNGYLMLAEALYSDPKGKAEGWNFGPVDQDARPVSWICDELTRRWGGGASWMLDGEEFHHEATYLKLDSSKAQAELGWRSKLSLSEALDWILDWNRRADNGEDLRQVTLQQISSFQEY